MSRLALLSVSILAACTTEGILIPPPCVPQTHTPTPFEESRIGVLADQLDRMEVDFDLGATDIRDSLTWSIQRTFPVVAEYGDELNCVGWDEDVVELEWTGVVTSAEGLDLEGTGLIALGLVSGEVRWSFDLLGEPVLASAWAADLETRTCGLQGSSTLIDLGGNGRRHGEQDAPSGNFAHRGSGCIGSYGTWGPD